MTQTQQPVALAPGAPPTAGRARGPAALGFLREAALLPVLVVILVVGACYIAASGLYAALTIRRQKGEPQSPPARPTQAVPR